jgi:hypothetical protein
MRMLTVNVDEELAHFAQLCEGSAVAVDEAARTPGLVHDPPQQNAARVAAKLASFQV